MSANLTALFGKQYATNIQMLLQQKQSRLRGLVTVGNYKGKSASPVDQMGAINMQPVVGRFAPMGRVDAPVDRRWVYPSDFDLPQLIDSFDKLKMLHDPTSSYSQNAMMAANRKMDDLIITAFFADAKTGEEGATTTTFPAGNVVAVNEGSSGNTGLTVAKLRAAKKFLRANEVDFESDPITAVISAEQEDDLLAEAQIISLDYNDRPVLVDGRVQRFLGINFIHSERLGVDGSSYRKVPIFAKSGMHLGIWEDAHVSVSQRHDLSGEPYQAYLKMSMGATRLEEDKIVQVLCAE